MKNPLRRTKVVIRPTRPDPVAEPLSKHEVEMVRNWSLRGVPTSAPVVLSLLAHFEGGAS